LNLAKHKKTRLEMHWTKARARVFSILCVSMCSRSLNSSPKGPDPPTTQPPPCVKISFGPNAQGPSQISPLHQKNLVLCTRGSNQISLFMCPKRWSPVHLFV